MPFQQFGLSRSSSGPFRKCATRPDPIQEKAIPHVLQGRTCSAPPDRHRKDGRLRAADPSPPRRCDPDRPGAAARPFAHPHPTRELAIQIGDSFGDYGRHTGMRHAVIYGGVSQKPQEQALQKGVDILVATPGRLLDLMGQKLVNLSTVEIFVLDEADRMLDMGFIVDIRRIIEKLPRNGRR